MSCVPLPHLQEPPAWVWSAVCPVEFALPAAAFDVATFDCETGPLFPGLRTRTEMFSFDAPFCTVRAPARAPCWLSADWPMTCEPALPHLQESEPPPWV